MGENDAGTLLKKRPRTHAKLLICGLFKAHGLRIRE